MSIFIKRTLKISSLFLVAIILSCKKSTPTPTPPTPPGGGTGGTDTTIKPGVDPATANTIGFFLDDWQAKTFTAPSYAEATLAVGATSTVTVDATAIITKIPLLFVCCTMV